MRLDYSITCLWILSFYVSTIYKFNFNFHYYDFIVKNRYKCINVWIIIMYYILVHIKIILTQT